MSIYLYQNNEQTGPFSEDQVLQMLQAAVVSPETLGWKEGMPSWKCLSTFVSSPSNGIQPTLSRRNSLFGIISFIFGLVSLVAWLGLLIVVGIVHKAGTVTQTFNVIVGFFFMVGILLNFVAVIFGLIGSFNSKAKILAVTGACLNGLILISLVILACCGLVAKHGHP